MVDYVAIANQYIDDVLSKKISACKWVKLACKRQKKDLTRKRWPYHFDTNKANRVCRFMEALKHTKGPKAGERIHLEPWQCFILTTIFGWVDKSGNRRFRRVLIEVPRGNGKSILASGVGLYMLCADGEIGADCYSFATTGDQARIVFNDACAMVQNNTALKDYFGIQVFKNSICIGSTNSKFQPKSSNSSTNDGLNTHFACMDELHAHKDRLLFDVVKTSMGKRKQSLMWSITTAGYNLQGVWMEERIKTQKMLEGLYSQDTRFGIIYTIDDGDDWKTEEALIKANPNWGISVNPIDVLDELKEAKINPTNEVEYQTKRLDLPCNSNTVWMPLTRWSKCYRDVKESEFDREYCIMGADLASKLDITALVRLYWRQEENPKTGALELHFYAFGDYFLPSDTVEQSSNANYRVWVNQGLMTTTEGAVIDLNQVQDKILEICQQKTVIAVAYDPFQATQLATNLLNEGCRMVEIGQTVKNLSEPMKFCKELVYQKRLHTDGSPILAWMVTNVIAHLDAKENIFPRKALPTDKIDGVLALLMCLNQVIHLDIENKYQNGDTISDDMLVL